MTPILIEQVVEALRIGLIHDHLPIAFIIPR